jgi:hypothetical protein
MKNYKKSDVRFFQDAFKQFENSKKGYNITDEPTNYNGLIDQFKMKYLFEIGYKKAFTMLTTDTHEKKCDYIDTNFFFNKKYCNMYPKSCYLGSRQDEKFAKKSKKIGDISFDELNNEEEKVINLNRLPPDYITDESLKSNLDNKCEILRLENCYWLSKDVISKVGRMDINLKELSLRNLSIDNSTLLNIVRNILQ